MEVQPWQTGFLSRNANDSFQPVDLSRSMPDSNREPDDEAEARAQVEMRKRVEVRRRRIGQRQRSGCIRNISIFGVVTAATLLIIVVFSWHSGRERSAEPIAANKELLAGRMSPPPDLHLPIAQGLPADQAPRAAHPQSSKCILHVGFGPAYMRLGSLSIPNKRSYAKHWGYKMVAFQQMSAEELLDKDFGMCRERAVKLDAGYDVQTVIKFCGMLQCFKLGCTEVLWTDADAVVARPDIPLSHWTDQAPSADVVWSMENVQGSESFCKGDRIADKAERLASCLNSGVFIMRNTQWTVSYIWHILRASTHTLEKNCSTASVNPEQYDQCYFTVLHPLQRELGHEGDQCVVACDLLANPSQMEHFHVIDKSARPSMQYAMVSMFGFPRFLLWVRSKFPMEAFVINCVAHYKPEQAALCVHFLVDKLHSKYPTIV